MRKSSTLCAYFCGEHITGYNRAVRIGELYTLGKAVYSLEFFTPKDQSGKESLLRALERLMTIKPAFVSVTCGAAGTTRERTADLSIEIQRSFGIPTMAHLVCTGTTLPELGETIRYMTESGIENILALRGDPPRGDSTWKPVPGGLKHANELIGFIKTNFDLCVAGACYPEKHHEARSLEEDIAHLKRKVDAGAEFLITQVFFDNRVYFRFLDLIRKIGIQIPVIPGVMPLASLANLQRIATLSPGTHIPPQLTQLLEKYSDPKDAIEAAAGYAAEQCADLLKQGAPGIHFYTLNRSAPTLRCVELIT